MTHTEMKEKAFEILRGSMEYNHLTDSELKKNIEEAGASILMAFIEEYED